jgi:hypothetical protein
MLSFTRLYLSSEKAPTLDTFLFETPLIVRLAFFLLTTLLERRPCLVSV